MYFLGFDIGSSSVKVSLLNGQDGKCIASGFSPKHEMAIVAHEKGWAEQDPELWWVHLREALGEVLTNSEINPETIGGIGISYQMHGLVLVDKHHHVIRPSIIWCDSRAAGIGSEAFQSLGQEHCLEHLLNSPGNFTASKLKWVLDNEPHLVDQIDKVLLPGDFIALKLTGEAGTTVSGLSEGIFWDFKENQVAKFLLDYYGIQEQWMPTILPTFGEQGRLIASVAAELGLKAGIPVTYRAGDQPNNALSLQVLNPGEVATTAGTSGVVYGVTDQIRFDPDSRVNTFAHVNHQEKDPRLGVLLCINGTGILNSWLHHQVGQGEFKYEEMNAKAAQAPIGADGLAVLPFGNGAERVLKNATPGASFSGLDFNRHNINHLFRAAQEGIVFSFKYGMDHMANLGVNPSVIRAGKANMFLSPLFRETLAGITGARIELFNTDGSQGAARGAAMGAGYYNTHKEAFSGLVCEGVVEPDKGREEAYQEAYGSWLEKLEKELS